MWRKENTKRWLLSLPRAPEATRFHTQKNDTNLICMPVTLIFIQNHSNNSTHPTLPTFSPPLQTATHLRCKSHTFARTVVDLHSICAAAAIPQPPHAVSAFAQSARVLIFAHASLDDFLDSAREGHTHKQSMAVASRGC